MWITLPYYGNRQFHLSRLIRELIENRRMDYIIQGQQEVTYNNHSKQSSLDYWLRTIANNSNMKQATNAVINQICDTGLFEITEDLQCPDAGTRCKGIRLVRHEDFREKG